jgi:hypothetical protein
MKKYCLALFLAALCVFLSACGNPDTAANHGEEKKMIVVGFPRWAQKATGGKPTPSVCRRLFPLKTVTA